MKKLLDSVRVDSSLLPVFGLLGAMLFWGTSFIAMKVALRIFDPLVMVFGRMGLAALIFLFFHKKLRQFTYRSGDWKYLTLMALCEPCLYFIFESYALTYTTASQAGMVTALLPLIVAVSAGVLLKENTNLTTLLGFVIAVGGIVLITSQSLRSQDAPNPFLGNMLEFLAMCCAAGYTILARYMGTRYSPFFLTAIQMFLGTLFFAPVLAFPSTNFPTHWPLIPTLAILYLGTCVSFLAYGFFNYGLSKVPASQAAAYVNLIPVISVLSGWLILGESLTLFQIFGMGCVLLGVWMSSSGNRCRKLQPSSV